MFIGPQSAQRSLYTKKQNQGEIQDKPTKDQAHKIKDLGKCEI